ncbi:aminotransferase class I/II-fold pyridoxal phosphate-dependent enzyme [Pseudomonadota bacterium]
MSKYETVADLAVFNGIPAFDQPLHVGRPNVGNVDAFFSRAKDIFERRWLTNDGPYVQEFENRIASMLGVKHCVAMCNGTVALEIAIRALELHGEVIVPSFTFIATAHALQWQEITPVFCDVDRTTHTIDPIRIEEHITPRTTGIVGVHLWGRPCDIESLSELSKRHGLALMFDAAHALGCSHEGRMIGNFGELEVLSFHATKILNTFEGGAIVTNRTDLVEKLQFMRNFGFSGYDKVDWIGTNGKMSEISAAMGLSGLDCLDDVVAHNRLNYLTYMREFEDIQGVRLLEFDETEHCNYHYVVAEVDEAVSGITRDVLVGLLHRENVMVRRYFYPGCHRMEPYRSYFPHAGLMLPNTEYLSERVFCLPTGTAIQTDTVQKVCGLIRLIIERIDEVDYRLSQSS